MRRSTRRKMRILFIGTAVAIGLLISIAGTALAHV
jgi:hypothetical protein